MTKPGNSGSEEPKQAEQTREPETPDSASAETRPEDTSSEPEPTSAEPAAEAEPADEKPAEAEPEEVKPEEAEARTARTQRADAKAAAAKASADEDGEPLMAELEKAPPPPREETLRVKSSAPRSFDEPPPRTLKFSFYFFVASGLVWLISGIIFLINKQVIIDAQVESNDRRDISAEQIASAVNQLLWFYLVIALVFTVFLALFGWKATEGTRRARTLVTIFSAIMVIFHLLLFSTQFGILSALLALVGLALIWSRTARAHFPPRQQPLS